VSTAIKTKEIDYKEQLNIIFDALEDKKATDIVMLDLTAVSDSLDYFVICSATSQPQMSALERHVLEKLLEVDVRAVGVEGPSPRWVLINLGAILVHLMTPETRDFYDLEGLWADAKQVPR
jgi:ribosome-associated protein